ncbi:MAG: OmpH family outer membrane protein [Candidatus Kapaibacterium sp.]
MTRLAIRLFTLTLVCMVFVPSQGFAQKVGYMASQAIRERWQDMIQAQQRIQSLVDDWKRELGTMQKKIDELDAEVKKNRLVWSAEERQTKETELARAKSAKEEFAHRKFDPGGEYDGQATSILKNVEEKLYLAAQDVAAAEGFDIIMDKSTQPIPYANPKYDLTVKVMKKLNIPAEDLEEKQKKAIEEDPKNKKDREQPAAPRKRSRSSEPKPDEPKQDIKPAEPPVVTPSSEIPR